jgi:hypothetical protein
MDLVSVCKNTPKINTHYLNKKKKKKEYQEEIQAWRQIFVPHRTAHTSDIILALIPSKPSTKT